MSVSQSADVNIEMFKYSIEYKDQSFQISICKQQRYLEFDDFIRKRLNIGASVQVVYKNNLNEGIYIFLLCI